MRDQVGLMIARGLAKGIQKGEKEVLHVADTLNQKLLDKEEALTKQLEETGLDEATKEALTEQLNVVKEFRSEYEKALEDIQKSQDSMAQKLKDYGDLFQTVKTETGSFLELNDLEAQINGIERYGEALEASRPGGCRTAWLERLWGERGRRHSLHGKALGHDRRPVHRVYGPLAAETAGGPGHCPDVLPG